ncbi:MAG: hypothetical protein E6H01_04170 [Bacillati bacterium ANGP1]|uniref:Alanyl-tRNA synthetase class IIc N-terminal domain-containing protein n=1 Tax=Candidatus Segetimicrobium genomatis TaxID=2569760 RepID=A0A537L8T5_9BACT|nr:MAG: hypothetical protein E6H01_04170 [Terrabacteria group bacterium ANGP1]
MTLRLYYTDSYLKKFDATVLAVEPHGDRLAVILDRSAFYPTSGGQPHDTGTLGGLPVTEVIEDDEDRVLHVVSGPITGIVTGGIDWPRRFGSTPGSTSFRRHSSRRWGRRHAPCTWEPSSPRWTLISPNSQRYQRDKWKTSPTGSYSRTGRCRSARSTSRNFPASGSAARLRSAAASGWSTSRSSTARPAAAPTCGARVRSGPSSCAGGSASKEVYAWNFCAGGVRCATPGGRTRSLGTSRRSCQ